MLTASNNRLATLPDSIGSATGLSSLGLSSNHLAALPYSIGDLRRSPMECSRAAQRGLALRHARAARPPRTTPVSGMRAILAFLRTRTPDIPAHAHPRRPGTAQSWAEARARSEELGPK